MTARSRSSFGSMVSISLAHRRDEDVGHLGTAELGWGTLARPQELTHLGARQRHVVGRVVGAGLARRHAGAAAAVEAVLEAQRGDPDLLGRVALEDALRVVGAVVVADAGVVAPD